MSTLQVSAPDPATGLSRVSAISAALRQHDPAAQVAFDPTDGRVQVLTVLPQEEVERILRALGEAAVADDSVQDREGGDGCCGCGCRG